MKKTIFNYDFKLKDFEATKSRHLGQIKKTKADKEITLDIMGYDTQDVIISYLVGDRHYYFDTWFKDKPITKTLLRSLKCFVNGQYYEQIKRNLKWNEKPESWATAFYCIYYKKINTEMKAITKEIIRSYI